MKTLRHIIIASSCLLALSACNKEDIIEPKACFSADVQQANVDEPITFTNCGEGMAFSIWPGDSYHKYAHFGVDAGLQLDGDEFTYAYPEPGEFTVTMVASSFGNNGEDVFQDVDSMHVTITDNRTEITEFGFRSPKVVGSINGYEMEAIVPYGTDLTRLKATFKTSSKFAKVMVDGVEQRSGKTANDFTKPVEFTVVAQTGESAVYTAHVYSIPDTAKELTYFAIKGVEGIFSGTDIMLTLPAGNSDLSSLKAEFETSSDKAVVLVDGTEQTSGSTRNDFSNPVEYVVSAEDESSRTYTVVVEEEIGFLDFSFQQLVPPVYAQIDGYELLVEVLEGTPVDSLYASFTVTQHDPVVRIGEIIQESGVSLNDFSSPVIYTLEADGRSVEYTVRVKVIK